MKCDNCGKEEVNFHYTSNINGNITEKHLCADCAVKQGFDRVLGNADRSLIQPDASFEDIFMDLFGTQPSKRMFGGYGMMIPTFIIPTMSAVVPGNSLKTAPGNPDTQPEVKVEIDAEMKKRREINILREQMHQAAEAEDFEKAAALRDSIKKLEGSINL